MGVMPKPGDRSSCMAHSLVVAPGLGVYILSTQAAFFQSCVQQPYDFILDARSSC